MLNKKKKKALGGFVVFHIKVCHVNIFLDSSRKKLKMFRYHRNVL